jgi:hypothetical protein
MMVDELQGEEKFSQVFEDFGNLLPPFRCTFSGILVGDHFTQIPGGRSHTQSDTFSGQTAISELCGYMENSTTC